MEAFVIMPFRPELDSIYHKIIDPTCSDLGIKVLRADKILDPGSIPQQIYDSIRDSLFVIAEISLQNDNVFYELGYAHALNKKAILLSNRQRQLPFDVSVTRTIIYDQNIENWENTLADNLRLTINHLYNLSERLIIYDLQTGQELEGHMNTISGQLFKLELYQHFWFFAKREDLDTWWPQDDGEVQVYRDGTWKAQLFLGRDDRKVDINCYYDIKFGFIDTPDNRELTEFCIKSKERKMFPGIRHLPRSFEELAHIKVKRVNH